MKLKKILTWRIYLLLIVVILSIFAIKPMPFAEGIQVKSSMGTALENGLAKGLIINSINGIEIESINQFYEVLEKESIIEPIEITVKTSSESVKYEIKNSFNFTIDENLTITSADNTAITEGSKLISIDDKELNNITELIKIQKRLMPTAKITISTNKGGIAFLTSETPKIVVQEAEKSNLKKGLDLSGGTRVLLKPEEEVTEKDIQDIIKVLNNRLNVYGLTDIKIKSANDLSGNKFILVEIAGATKEEVEELIAKQGKFEAKIDNKTVFEGGKKDIPLVCRGDGSCSGIIPPCSMVENGQAYCRFQFSIKLSAEAAKKHATITKDIELDPETKNEYLKENLDLFLDDNLVDSLRIGADLRGSETTSIAISGPGYGKTEAEAYNDALESMDKLQTILITGSLPFKLEIVKLDNISPILGESFTRNIIITSLIALLGIAVFIFIRYRNLKIILPMLLTCVSEVIIILGFAALIEWNLDLVSIAGIIAAVGTGIDDQIVITDEVLKGEGRFLNWKQKIKRAFFIIIAAYATTVAAMIPLWYAGAGLIRGLAVTTIIGVTVGVLLTRPAFASVIEKLLD